MIEINFYKSGSGRLTLMSNHVPRIGELVQLCADLDGEHIEFSGIVYAVNWHFGNEQTVVVILS